MSPTTDSPRPKRLLDIVQAATTYLTEKGVEQPRLTTELLAAYVLRCKRLEIYLRFESMLSDAQIQSLRAGIRRVGNGEPLQYVIGETDFMGHRMVTDRRALIPRPETELLVETVLAEGSLWKDRHPVVADVGTGTGCVAISLALAKPDADYLALDVSRDALSLAELNMRAYGLEEKIQLVNADLLAALPPESLDVAVANLPYVPTKEWEGLPKHIHDHEPRMALDGGADGLDLVRTLLTQAGSVLRPGGSILLEIGHDQGVAVRALMSGLAAVQLRRDYDGHERVIWGSKAK